jgi:hypothetical protein
MHRPRLTQGYLMPTYHQNYWMGLVSTVPQKFSLIDITLPNLTSAGAYKNWGRIKPVTGAMEPDSAFPPENCAVANWTERQGSPEAWGWADTSCMGTWASICRLEGGASDILRQSHTQAAAL